MKVLITGGTGLLGFYLVKAFVERGYDVYASYHKHDPISWERVKWVYLDLEDPENVNENVRTIKPDIIIHSAAYTDVDGCEINRSLAYRVNYLATKVLTRSALKSGSFMVYVSTDYVFDGEKGAYREDDVPGPVNFYGLTKLLGEIAVESILPKKGSLIVRVSGLYGHSPTGKRNFGLNALERLVQGKEVAAFIDQVLSPTYAYHLAYSILKAVEKEVHGFLHLAGKKMSRFEFAIALAEILNVDRNLVKPISINDAKLIAKRPRDSSLDTSRAENLGLALPPQKDCIRHFVESYRRSAMEV